VCGGGGGGGGGGGVGLCVLKTAHSHHLWAAAARDIQARKCKVNVDSQQQRFFYSGV
jgi:hypothetical protein